MPDKRNEREGEMRSSGSPWLFLFCALLTAFILLSAAREVRGVSTRTSAPEIGLEGKLEAERRLADLGYWTGPVDGKLDPASRQALIAFQKVEGRPRTGRLTLAELEALQSAAKPVPRYTGSPHIEVDISRQVLFLVDESGSITHILPVCTGNEKSYVDHGEVHRAHTPRGKFKVLRKISGWRRSSLGLLYYPNYVHEGIAIHGSPSIPAYPASHGCVRIPMFAARELSEITPIGTEVMIYPDRDPR